MTTTADGRATAKHLLIRADAGRHRGAGHIMRCLAVAEAAHARGWRLSLSADLSALPWVQPWIQALEVEVVPAAETVDALLALCPPGCADAILLDHYDYPELLSAAMDAQVVLANFEDGEFGRRAAHLSIDYALGAESVTRPDDGSVTCLRGVAYAPIRRDIRAARAQSQRGSRRRGDGGERDGAERVDQDRASRVLVLMGGTDARHLGGYVVELLVSSGVQAVSPPIGLGLTDVLATVDAVVSAAGVSAYELCCLGMPMGLVQVAANQQDNYHRLTSCGAATGLGTAGRVLAVPDEFQADVSSWLATTHLGARAAARAQALVDGLGADRILLALSRLVRT